MSRRDVAADEFERALKEARRRSRPTAKHVAKFAHLLEIEQNDAGVYSVQCSCGWRASKAHADRKKARASASRHAESIAKVGMHGYSELGLARAMRQVQTQNFQTLTDEEVAAFMRVSGQLIWSLRRKARN